ncbi:MULTISPECIES: type II toxin-antitoxin system YafO family toxin [Photorhabdus]|uniref:Type II toxin-antitoxin system YafO family toxin n=2 Tax=Photorhabdus TaxID=29487 RepID=A0ABX0B1X8_9GAMM|nr:MULTISPECIES: type II toxin-antitoxin system YafO family toxin [Photorhabdus]PQQ38940.1 type II toxin-antitoxin system YafO family toxin [Photorhabdus luminescens]MBS9433410.1 type II toxin-antitoxin system YafO family toxin [Photorhabdus hainanensis]MBS9436929.1 type II toxin-antitoxin system YafO family toxin [Photorhabdus noenieputensis]MCC8373758.1 type II toxin-antitoxin system YafO family toxin [Photorhabdus bodei]MCC8456395.1 type II toxin-antitoxin system YafO family toxin [Photorha
MGVSVTVHKDVEFHEVAIVYAKLLEHWKRTALLPSVFGRDGQWEHNSRTLDSNIYKLHIRMPDEIPWEKYKPQIDRCSDNYLVYVQHWMDSKSFQVISIMSPKAHELAKTSFLTELERRAEEFHSI